MFETICISFALCFGLAFRRVGLPPMVGFLAAGFVIHAAGPGLGLPEKTGEVLEQLSHVGVLLLLFAVGLKLRLGQLVQAQVLGGALLLCAISAALFGLGLFLLIGAAGQTAVLLGIVLSFSSTVFSAKVLEAKRDIGTLYGRTAIGILIVQDILALAVLAIWGGQTPNLWALVLVAGLPVARPILHWLVSASGHDEMLLLAGMFLALVLGGAGFASVGLSAELGALVIGLMLSTHRQAKELSDALWGLKEIFLVGFFLQIGMSGLPGQADILLALGLAAVLPVKGALVFGLMLAFGLRSRTAFLTAANLMSYSEFALIVAAKVLPEWLVPLALAVSLSFVVAAPFDQLSQRIFDRLEPRLGRWQARRMHRDELPTDLGKARVLILGMGRTGTAAYDQLSGHEDQVIGIDADTYRVQGHHTDGRNVLWADVEDAGFWRGLRMAGIRAVILAMDNVDAKESAARALRQHGYSGPILSHALYEDYIPRLRQAGVTHTYLTMNQAGINLAEATGRLLEPQGPGGQDGPSG